MSASTERRCAACSALLFEGDRFCESCGAPLPSERAPSAGCQICGADDSAIGPDGYCSVCGARVPGVEDRVESDRGSAAALSDRGRVSRRNEDAFEVFAASRDRLAAVVCDGISSASSGNVAARDAAAAAGAVLSAALDDDGADLQATALRAVAEAQDAVARVPWTTRADRDTPSCTLVAAICRGRDVVVASVGDSRAYWLGGDDVRQLTVDDSWAQEQIEEGHLDSDQAHRDPRSHAITHWIGADAPSRPARLEAFTAPGPGRVVLCTDGLWNYVPSPAGLAQLIAALPADPSPAAIARALTEVALVRGGRDNITVAVLDLE